MPTSPRTSGSRAVDRRASTAGAGRRRPTGRDTKTAGGDAAGSTRSAPEAAGSPAFAGFADIAGFVGLARVTSLAVGPDGTRVVAAVQQPDADGAKYVSALWELDPEGSSPPRRLTFSTSGESDPRFAPDGSLLFTSARPDTGEQQSDAEKADSAAKQAVWRLPDHGEAQVVAATAGGLAIAGVADTAVILATTDVLAGVALNDDAEKRESRKDRGITAILHTGMPIRYWDHEIGDTSFRLVLAAIDGASGATDIAADADVISLLNAAADISPDGTTVATTWNRRTAGGDTITSLALIDTSGRRRRILLPGTARFSYRDPRFSPDGRTIAVVRETVANPSDTSYDFLELHPTVGGHPVLADLGDLTTSEYIWSADGDSLYVAGDLHSRGAIVAIDPATGKIRRTIADDAAYTSLRPTADGLWLYALRSTIDSPPTPVRLPVRRFGGMRTLPAPGRIDALPGSLNWVSTDVGGISVNGWLCTPKGASGKNPAPLMVWIHGGPHGSYNSWSWRWNPWLAVARGYAVLLPTRRCPPATVIPA
jgi:dipeptidyl aminopeptidase/acylaminoacyl peptidase